MTYEEVLERLKDIAKKLNEKEEVDLFQKLNKCIYDLEVIGNKVNEELNKIRKAIEEQL